MWYNDLHKYIRIIMIAKMPYYKLIIKVRNKIIFLELYHICILNIYSGHNHSITLSILLLFKSIRIGPRGDSDSSSTNTMTPLVATCLLI